MQQCLYPDKEIAYETAEAAACPSTARWRCERCGCINTRQSLFIATEETCSCRDPITKATATACTAEARSSHTKGDCFLLLRFHTLECTCEHAELQSTRSEGWCTGSHELGLCQRGR